MTRTLAIIGAMDVEVALIAKTLENVQEHTRAGVTIFDGTMPGTDIRVVATVAGMGTVNAAATTQHLIDVYEPECLLFSGIAGNLTDHLHINDVVLGKTLVYLDTDMRMISQSAPFTNEYHSDAHLLEVASTVLSEMSIEHLAGTIATGNTFVEGEAAERVKELTGADAVEMEGAAVAHVAARNEVPVLILRSLSDNADTEYETFHEFDVSVYADNAASIVLNIVKKLA
ncbi:5'-methylthioadenosine nucleosidase [Alloscardovia macacae]|uniref:adenosylhomocysteine nucleosidase n=1 Tax=Alloscardovia macacae TaxID=1160091 RepID=A0A1Y2SY82_9BIFI|nr:5'-methylthioadenosine/S-adenosylhomocysteine nucleosidase [Alloscardovia macacae]OTA27314.1 5'-methylthioadenosine nucleosidase [Alloscardovia macacae]OTA29322.1 5'-methylthioadenosine nucleosidase [Alloscardovia macacae]